MQKNKTEFLILLLGWLMLLSPAQAASFDCAKASTKVEHLICGNAELSKLDSKLGQDYQSVLRKANDEQRQRVVSEQRHWLKHTRNVCEDKTCLKLAYWSRQAELETFFVPKSPLYKHASDKADAIKQVLETAPLYSSYDTPFCRRIFNDLKHMKEIHFVDPVAQAQSYEDPVFDPWLKQCRALPQPNFHYKCVRNITPASIQEAVNVCDVGYGRPPFKLFELPSMGQSNAKRYVFYTDDGYGPMNQGLEKPHLGGGFAGFQQINLKNCEPTGHAFADEAKGEVNGTNYMGDVFADAGQGDRNGKNYNSIIEYKGHYYFVILNDNNSPYWWLYISSVLPNGADEKKICRWSPVFPHESDLSDQGSK
ncbi:MAG: DUF1311 domain-containing protein [Gammaproteobacteria bacterium]|nr:DUF1311 domain-containing protein [Gammaproteobacteria bacterium]